MNEIFEKKLFKAGIILAVAGVAFFVFLHIMDIDILNIYRCSFNRITGLYCPGCGGTRAVVYFFEGNIIKSFIYHPFVPYCMIFYIVFMLKGAWAYLFNDDKGYMKFRMCYVYLGITVLLVQFVIKNFLLIFCGISL